MRPLVSVLTPCYNSADFLHRLLDSILEQDYPSIEMYAIDDGSTDRTRQVIQTYIPVFQQRGYSLKYVSQSHSGQSEAINRGLKLIRGKYLVWPDSDDYYADSGAISKLVSRLEDSDESVSMVRCLPTYVDQSGNVCDGFRIDNLDKENLFEDCIFGTNGFWYLSGGYMIKTGMLDKSLGIRCISTAPNAGQNWQLLLPLLYGHRCLTIKEYLYKVVIWEGSHSRGSYKTYRELLHKYRDFERVLVQTLKRMSSLPKKEKRMYIGQIRDMYRNIYFRHRINHLKTMGKRIVRNLISFICHDRRER